MEWIAACLASAAIAQGAEAPKPVTVTATPAPQVVVESTPTMGETKYIDANWSSSGRKPFESDHAFDNFIGPISSPILSKDPRSLTEIRGLYVHNWIPSGSALAGGHYDAMAAQIRVALTDRLTFIADKDGYLAINPGNRAIGQRNGLLNLAAGLKYTFLRDEESQTLAAAGIMYEIPTGEAAVFQNQGKGVITPFLTFGKEFDGNFHVLGNVAYSSGLSNENNSNFLFTQLHVDKGFNCWLYPLFEVNWYHWTNSGRAFPEVVGEGDGLLNLGTMGMAGKNMVTIAPGLKAKISKHIETGFVYERAVTGRKDTLDHRFIGELILRF